MPTSTERSPQSKTGLPGGGYTARENPDGSWDILDVEILGPVAAGARKNPNPIGRAWFHAAIGTSRRRVSEGYLAPLHVYHHDDYGTKRTIRAGFFLPTKVRPIRYEGKTTDVTFADLKSIPPKIFEIIERGELPYRSVEVHSWATPEINSLALLPDEVPYFRFPALWISKKIPYRGEAPEEPARFFAVEDGYAAVAVFKLEEDSRMAIEKIDPKTGKPVEISRDELAEIRTGPDRFADEEDDEVDISIDVDDDEGADLEDEEEKDAAELQDEEPVDAPPPEAIEEAPVEEAPPAWAGAMISGLEALNAGVGKVLELLGGAPEAPSPQETAPVAPPPPQAFTVEEAKRAGEVAGLRAKDRSRQKSDKLRATIDKTIADLTADGYEIDKGAREKLEVAARSGKAVLKAFVGVFRENAFQDPPETLDALDGEGSEPRLPPEVMSYRDRPELFSIAQEASATFDALGKRVGTQSRKRFIEVEVARATAS